MTVDAQERIALGWYLHNVIHPADYEDVLVFLEGAMDEALENVVEKYETREGAK